MIERNDKIMRSNKRWTTDEHKLLETTIRDALSNGETLVKAYKTAAFKTGRSVEACRWRWKNIVSSQKEQETKKMAKVTSLPLNKNKSQPLSSLKQTTNLSIIDLFNEVFGPSLKILELFPKPSSNDEDLDVSNLEVFPIYGKYEKDIDYCVIDKTTSEAYLVCLIADDKYFCSCQNHFQTSNCRHVRKMKSEKNKK